MISNMEEENNATRQKKLIDDVILSVSKIKENKQERYIEVLKQYKPLNLDDFVFGINNNIKNKMMFYYKNKKYIFPFLWRKNKKIDFYTFVLQNSPHILEIKDINRRLEIFGKYGTQPHYSKTKIKPKKTFEKYFMNSLEKRVSLYLEKQKLFIRLLEIQDILNGSKRLSVNNNLPLLLKERDILKDKIENLNIKIYETQKHK